MTGIAPTETSSASLRRTMREFATGVVLITTRDDNGNYDAITVNSLASHSLTPPLVSVGIRSDSMFLSHVRQAGTWAASILDIASDDIAHQFSQERRIRQASINSLGMVTSGVTGNPVLPNCAWLECRVVELKEVGTNTLVFGSVVQATTHEVRPPLVFHSGRFMAVAAAPNSHRYVRKGW